MGSALLKPTTGYRGQGCKSTLSINEFLRYWYISGTTVFRKLNAITQALVQLASTSSNSSGLAEYVIYSLAGMHCLPYQIQAQGLKAQHQDSLCSDHKRTSH